jgi:hypothetical protein
MTDGHEPTAKQRSWELLAEKVRQKLMEQAEMIPAMKPDELKCFMDSIREAYWIDHYATTFDKRVDIELSKHAFTD